MTKPGSEIKSLTCTHISNVVVVTKQQRQLQQQRQQQQATTNKKAQKSESLDDSP